MVPSSISGERYAKETRRIGTALVFERMRAETGLQAVTEALAATCKHDFALKQTMFLTVLHRPIAGDTDSHAARRREHNSNAGDPDPRSA